MRRIIKQTVGPTATSVITSPVLGGLPAAVDNIAQIVQGYASADQKQKAKQKLAQQNPMWALVPGKAGSNRARRRIQMQKLLTGKGHPSKLLGQNLNISWLLPTLAGGVIGGLVGGSSKHDRLEGMTYGAGAGAAVAAGAHLLATVLAACTRKRTLEEQKAYQNSGLVTAGNLLLPGLGPYNYWKSIGAMNSQQYQDALQRSYGKREVQHV